MNPNDVFPRRNLPDSAEEWGRAVEKRIRNVEYAATTTKQSSNGLNRTTASSLQELSRQIAELQRIYNAIPKSAQATGANTDFGLGVSWTTIATATMPIPEGANRVSLIALGSGHILSQTTPGSPGDMMQRLSFAGVGVSPQVWSAWFTGFSRYEASINAMYTWNVAVQPTDTITVSLQVDPVNAIWPSGTGSYAVVALLATFFG